MSGIENNRSRSRSPRDKTQRWELKYEETTSREGLERHAGAKRSTQPAWMTKGMGIGKEMFGEPVGLLKPGEKPMSAASPAVQQPKDDYDPMGDVYRDAALEKEEAQLEKELKHLADLKEASKPKEEPKQAPAAPATTPAPTAATTPVPTPEPSAAPGPSPDEFLAKFQQAAGETA